LLGDDSKAATINRFIFLNSNIQPNFTVFYTNQK
jgi:hypothetical protein